MSISKNTIEKIGHFACLVDTMPQTYPIYACTGTNHACHRIGSRYILLQLEVSVFMVTLEKKNWIEIKPLAFETDRYLICGKIT